MQKIIEIWCKSDPQMEPQSMQKHIKNQSKIRLRIYEENQQKTRFSEGQKTR